MSFLKFVDAPGSIGFLLLSAAIGLVLAFWWPRRRGLTRAWFAGLAVSYTLLAMPVVAHTIASLLPAVPASPPRSIDALVVLDGDNRRGRVREALVALNRSPKMGVWVLGEDWVVDALVEAGVERGRIRHDTTTLTTREQMAAVERLIGERPPRRLAIVASRLQMPRVAALTHFHSLDVALLASPVDDEPATSGRGAYIPRYIALRVSRDALYEHAAIAWYRWHGWI